MDSNFLILGNDEKMKSCKKRLNELGFRADTFEENTVIDNYNCIVLPLPTVKDGCITGTDISVEQLNSMLTDKHTVFCGNVSPDIFSCRAFSYYNDKGFLIKNSRLTAQGTLKIILENVKDDLRCLSAAVIGYGRCGREICRTLRNTGVEVTSFSRRNETLVMAENDGMHSESIININKKLSNFDIIINTVPCNIIDTSGLEMKNLYIEIASKPYGFNITETDKSGFRYVLAESLPGKFTPVSAGRNIADTVAGIKEGIKT